MCIVTLPDSTKAVLKVIERNSDEFVNVQRLRERSAALQLVPVLRVVEDFMNVLGGPKALVVMPLLRPLVKWSLTAPPSDLRVAIASACEVGVLRLGRAARVYPCCTVALSR